MKSLISQTLLNHSNNCNLSKIAWNSLPLQNSTVNKFTYKTHAGYVKESSVTSWDLRLCWVAWSVSPLFPVLTPVRVVAYESLRGKKWKKKNKDENNLVSNKHQTRLEEKHTHIYLVCNNFYLIFLSYLAQS